ncbi:MAG: VacJ family lipoprotein [Nitrospirota bacterium]|nr:VacJ family lipoprotein [Nitrospirota bacterium]
MKTDERLWMPFVAVLVVLLFTMPGSSSALDAAEPENHGNAGSGVVDSAVLNELSAVPGTTAQSYYIVNDDLYVLMQKPMAKAYGVFSLVPIIVSDAVMDTGSSDLSSGDTLLADAGSADKVNENYGVEIAMNMNFRGETDKTEELAPGVDSPRDNEYIADPLEPLNRVFFIFNDKLYFWALKPVSSVYGFIVPEWGRTRVRNVFDNIRAPIRLVNALLQLKMHKFGAEFARFVLNSTVGIGGLFDIASRHPELKTSEEDLGQTFGSYGLGEGFYLVLPFLGPSSLRDTAGTVGDYFLDPIGLITPLQDAVAVRSFDQVNDTSFKIGDYEDIKESALDPYLSIKDMYKQYRRSKIRE